MRLDLISTFSEHVYIAHPGFGYDFNALNLEGKPTELGLAFQKLFMSSSEGQTSALAQVLSSFPILALVVRHISIYAHAHANGYYRVSQPNKRLKDMASASAAIKRVGLQLVAERRTAVLREASENHKDRIEREDLQGRDLLTLLIKANMAKDVPDNQRLSDEDVLGREFLPCTNCTSVI